ncbi:hypothetical protein SEA_LTON_53 [Gordonia phage Lton]|nr:hypothetical protein SEA_LTON_53 [Gordonia phage Lton]
MTHCKDCGRMIIAAWGSYCWTCTAVHVIAEAGGSDVG